MIRPIITSLFRECMIVRVAVLQGCSCETPDRVISSPAPHPSNGDLFTLRRISCDFSPGFWADLQSPTSTDPVRSR
ncbi:hypothetical protein HBI75_032270 [Parastagonospora nodorum]|nr:hypothetical protein HBI75_032270 [Parastagonospora nodorum]KAH5388851.1 hypothetical protein HBI33_045960 [Parastagonospora nodorum]KAH5611416.1 hypothetical protein HBI45_062360 [Parastagonospora nodorum]